MKKASASETEQLRLAVELYQKGNLGGAARIFDQLITKDAGNFQALHFLGLIEVAKGNLRRAKDLMGRSVAMQPGNIHFLQNYAGVLYQAGDHESCQRSCEQGLRLEPANAYLMHLSATALFNLKRLEESLSRYDAVVGLQPRNFTVVNERGCVLAEMGRFEAALLGFDRAATLDPRLADPWLNKGAVLIQLGRHTEALSAYERAVALQPESAAAWCGRGLALFGLGHFRDAAAAYDRALAAKPDLAHAWLGRGNAYVALERYEEAVAAFDQALAIKPDLADAWQGRGNGLFQLWRLDLAGEAYDKALAIAPELAGAWHGRGGVLFRLHRHDEALAAYDRALAIKPDLAAAWCGRGNVLFELNRCEDAVVAYDRSLALEPRAAGTWYARGNVFFRLRRHDEALAAYDKAILIDPNLKHARGLRLLTRQLICDWRDFDAECSVLIEATRRGDCATFPFAMLAIPSSCADQLRCAEIDTAARYSKVRSVPQRSGRFTHDRVRLAYISADFRRHAVGYLLPELFELHDRARFEITGLSLDSGDGSDLRTRLVRSFDHFYDVSAKSDSEVANLLRDLEVDIVVDLMGHTDRSRLGIFAARAAPIQVSYLGFLGTTGVNFIDYILADKIALPFKLQPFFTERIVHLPDCFLVNDRNLGIAPRCPSRSEAGLPADGFVFCSFNSPYKIQRPVFAIWMRLLRRVKGSVLWLWRVSEIMCKNLRNEAEAAGIDPIRLVFAPSLDLPDHLARYRLADLALDTLPYGSGATGLGALWSGVPLLTCVGETFAGRMGASMLHAIGLPELVTETLEHYEALALKLAADPQMLGALRRRLAENRLVYPLFETDRFRRHLEAAFFTMREHHRQGRAPESFAVAPIN